MVSGDAAMICLSGFFPGHERKYGQGGYRMLVAEAGHISQNLILTATALGLSARPFGGVFDGLLNHGLELDGVEEQLCWRSSSGTAERRRGQRARHLIIDDPISPGSSPANCEGQAGTRLIVGPVAAGFRDMAIAAVPAHGGRKEPHRLHETSDWRSPSAAQLLHPVRSSLHRSRAKDPGASNKEWGRDPSRIDCWPGTGAPRVEFRESPVDRRNAGCGSSARHLRDRPNPSGTPGVAASPTRKDGGRPAAAALARRLRDSRSGFTSVSVGTTESRWLIQEDIGMKMRTIACSLLTIILCATLAAQAQERKLRRLREQSSKDDQRRAVRFENLTRLPWRRNHCDGIHHHNDGA